MSVPNSPANTAELIAEARAWLVEHGYGSSTADMLRRLADALDAATAAPSEADRG